MTRASIFIAIDDGSAIVQDSLRCCGKTLATIRLHSGEEWLAMPARRERDRATGRHLTVAAQATTMDDAITQWPVALDCPRCGSGFLIHPLKDDVGYLLPAEGVLYRAHTWSDDPIRVGDGLTGYDLATAGPPTELGSHFVSVRLGPAVKANVRK